MNVGRQPSYHDQCLLKQTCVETMSNFIGPALPPHLLQAASNDGDSNATDEEKNILCSAKENVDIGPNLPPHILRAASEDAVSSDWERGPPQLLRKQITQSEMSEDSTDDVIGPVPPTCHKSIRKSVEDNGIGPSLPPHLLETLLKEKNSKMFSNKLSKSSDSSDDDSGMIGPVMPKHLRGSSDEEVSQDKSINVCVIGPKIPVFMRSERKQKAPVPRGNKNKEVPVIGPSLPPHLAERADELPMIVEDVPSYTVCKPKIGPSLPSHFQLADNLRREKTEDDSDIYGPALPPGFCPKTQPESVSKSQEGDSESDDADMGPLPQGAPSSKVQHQLEVRARQLRQAMASEKSETSEGPVRESWMLELPDDRAPELGLKPRQFRVREAPEAGDRSVWTDTPADRERKKRVPKSTSPDRGALERQALERRDEVMQKLAEQHGSKRGSRSLLEIHEEKLEAKRKKELQAGEVPDRRPFSREVDLQVNRFDEAQKRSILKKAQHLNDRFSGGRSKFL